ncbi:ribonuclease H-like domain-containing protein, partial [Amylostereum chailletii]
MGKAGAFHYAVKKGRAPGIYPTWSCREEAQKEVKNFRDARYKKFRDLGEAQDWMNEVEPVAGPATPATAPPSLRYEPLEKHRVEIGAAAGAKTSGAGDERWEFLYTDGACRNNGKPNAIAGIGVWWGRGDRRNISERCPGTQTNNRAELLAIIRALEVIPHSTRPLTIHTDSEYCVNAFTKWRDGWLRRNWRTALGEPVANQPMIKYLTALLALRLRRGQDVELKWVKGHAGNVGNEGADKLAVDGYDLPMIEERDWMALRDETDEIE